MKIIQGTGISSGVVEGRLVFNRPSEDAIFRQDGIGPKEEWQRVEEASKTAMAHLESLVRKYEETDPDSAGLFGAYILILKDNGFREKIQNILNEDNCNAEYAVYLAGRQYADRFASLDDVYIRERSADIMDVTWRLLRGFGVYPEDESGRSYDEPVILIADDLSASEIAHLDREHIQAVVLRGGSPYSHASIMMNTMGLPAICQLEISPDETLSGTMAFVDGDAGQVIIEADDQAQHLLKARIRAQKSIDKHFRYYKGKADETRDGRRMNIFCNISGPEDVAEVLANDGHGIGLFRSEFLLNGNGSWPSEDVQFEAYRDVIEAMKGKMVIIRTIDAGSDKKVADVGMDHEINPAMGLRSIRLSLIEPELFKNQLKAIYRASVYGNVSIMFPMVTDVEEIRRAKGLCREAKEALLAESVPFKEDVKIGIMVETPSAILMADEMAEEVDFFSLGTNDLTQFILACDRERTDMGEYYNPYHPAVLKAVKLAAEAAKRHGIPVGICGEIASDMSLLPYFLEIGIDEISVPPSAVLPLREKLRNIGVKKV